MRLQNVKARRRERISSDEEERRRQGYEVRTAVRFAEVDGHDVATDRHRSRRRGEQLATLVLRARGDGLADQLRLAPAKNKSSSGSSSTPRGPLGRSKTSGRRPRRDPTMASGRQAQGRRRVIPFVEDHRNCLILTRPRISRTSQMASLQAALKRGIQAVFQLEDQELAAEPLPTEQLRSRFCCCSSPPKAAPGFCGACSTTLRSSAEVAREALDDLPLRSRHRRRPRARARASAERCEAACYDCLLSYGNQRDHRLLDRHAIKDVLLALARCTVRASAYNRPRRRAAETLLNAPTRASSVASSSCSSRSSRRLPSDTQQLIADAHCRPDFLYQRATDRGLHRRPASTTSPTSSGDDRASRRPAWRTLGYDVVRFHYGEDWVSVLDAAPGRVRLANGSSELSRRPAPRLRSARWFALAVASGSSCPSHRPTRPARAPPARRHRR